MNEYIDKLKTVLKNRVMVFIDVANLEQSVKDMWVIPKDIPDELSGKIAGDLRWSVDYKKLKSFFSDICDLQDIKFYTPAFHNDGHIGFLYFLKKSLKFKLNTKPLKEYPDHSEDHPNRKANFDVEIAVDAVDKIKEYDTFVLFSGDCDFKYLIRYLKGKGKKIVVVFSRTGHVAKELPPISNKYFDIADFRHEFLRMELKKAKNPAEAGPCN